jgi:hypothetical protein
MDKNRLSKILQELNNNLQEDLRQDEAMNSSKDRTR